MSPFIIPLVVATVASGATAAIYANQCRYLNKQLQAMMRREKNHLDSIYLLRLQLKNARSLHPDA